jgi:hypothetical protein
MAGAGYKLFQTGDVLTAAQVNTYLNEQTVMVFASAAARTSALTSVLAEGMVSYLQDTNAVEVYDGSAWVSIGASGDITGVTAGTGISGGGTSGTVTITNSMATEITAAGDIIVGTGSGTFDNLPIGTTGQVLTADTTVSPYKVKWATAASSNGPAFSVYLNTQQSITASTWVKVQFEVEDFDTDSCYNNSSTYRFTPNKAGYYQFNYNAQVESGSSCLVALYKNGSIYHYGFKQNNNQANHGGACIVAYANGSSDYFEVYANGGTGSPSLNWGTDRRGSFSGVWIRS